MDSSLSLRDLLFYLGKRKKLLLSSTCVGILLFLGLILTKPVLYRANATFVDRGKSQNGMESSSLTLSLLSGSENGGQVLSLLQSERILEKTVIALGLQASISPTDSIPFLLRPFYHLRSGLAHFQNEKTPIFKDVLPPFRLKNLVYSGEDIASFQIVLQRDGSFIAEGKDPSIAFDFEPNFPTREGLYSVELLPRKAAVSDLKKSVLVEASKKISELILLDCFSTCRKDAALILNTLMAEAEKELQSIEKEGSSRQVAVLEERQAKSFDKLDKLLQAHAETLSRDLLQIGFIDTDKALSFYAQAEDTIEKDLLKLEFEKRRIEESIQLASSETERLSSLHELASLKVPFDELRKLKAKREALSLALLHKKPPQESASTYEGLSSDLASTLLLTYQKGIDEVEEKRRHLSHLLGQIDEETLPLSSIAMSFQDEGGKELGSKAKLLEVAYHDPKNRSQKEQERIQDELSLERLFLKSHFKGLHDLLTLREGLFQEKIVQLRKVTLAGVHQELSLLENEIITGMQDRLQRIGEERELLLEEKRQLGVKMAPLPTRWVEETLLKQKLHLHEHLFNEVTRLSENKEIASKLNLVLSSPLDHATPPLLPVDPKLILFSFLGGFSGFFLCLSFLLFEITRKGLPATPSSLKAQGFHVLEVSPIKQSASLQQMTDVELAALRTLLLRTKQSNLFLGGIASLTPLLCRLYQKKEGKKALLINLDGSFKEGTSPTFSIGEFYDELLLPNDRFLEDYLDSASFKQLIEECKKTTPCIFAFSTKSTLSLLALFDQTFLSIDEQSLDHLPDSKKILFVF